MINKTYSNLKILITANRYDYADMFSKLDIFFALDRITENEYIELTGMLVEPTPVEEPTVE